AAREAADAARLVSPRDAAIARLPANIDPASPAAIELINLLEEQAWPEAHTEYPVYLHGRSVTEHEAMLEASLQRMVARNAAADAPLVEEGQLEDDDEEEELDERDTAIQELHASLQAREDVLVAVQARLTALEASQAAVNAGVSPAVGLSSAAPVRSPPPHGLAAGQHRNTVANLFSAGRFSSGQPAGAVAPQSAAPQENDPSAADRRRPGSPHSYSGLVTPVAPVALVAPPLPVPTLQLPRLRRLLPRLPRTAFALKHALPLEPLPSAQKWSLADNTTLSCKQFATVDLCLPGHCATCKLTVMPSFVQGYDVLLGDDWLFANKAILSYEGKTLSLSAAGKTAVTLPCPAVAAPKYVGQCSAVRPTPAFLINALKAKPELISATQASRWLLKGGRAVVALVMTEGSASAGPGTPSDKDDPHIPAAIKAELQTLLDEYSDVFKPLTDTPPERPVGHTIPLVPDARPPVTPMYRLSKPEQEELKRQIQDYLSKGMIEPSSSPYAAPILFVQKKSGELRMCIDYRQLNKLTLRDQYPLPRIDDLFDRLSGCSVFSSLDLQAGYHQIRITPEDVPKTAFRTPEGHFQFKVLSFGLTNAPATFQRVMNDAFAPVLGKCALVYLDDILVMSKSLPEHLQHLRLVFDLLRKNKLYAKMSKCEFMQLTLRFLGHVISAGAISVDPDKVRAIVDWPVPSSLTQLQSFLGAANFVRKFVHNFSAISAPLTDLCGKLSATFPWHSWPDHERHAFYELKAAVANVPMLRLPDHTQPFQVYCDASLQGVGAVLMQDGYPLAYLSKKLSSAEVNYTTGEQEMLALVTACKEWRCYLEGVPFTLFTDHKPLISLPTQKNLSRRQARWMELLSRFDFKLEYIPGPVNPADPLSRLITGLQESATVCAMLTRRRAQLSREGEGASVARALEANAPAAVTAKSSSTPEITENTTDTSHNRDFVPLVTCTSDTSVHYPAAPAHPLGLSDQLIQGYRLDPAFNAEADLSSMYQDTHGLWRLTGKDKVVVPNDSELRNHILHEMHDAVYSGHVGISKTLERVSRVFWWNTMRADVRYYVSTCDACQRDKASTLKPGGLLNPLSIPDYRWESVSMDFITKLPSGSHGYDAICVFVDRLSKMVHFVPCREDLKARRFAQLFIDHVYKLHGMPAELISDRGSLFTSVFWREVMRRCGSKPALSSSYHPQSDGQTERYNRVLEEMLRHYISPTQSDWPDYLALAEFAVNNSWQESIQSTPFLVNTGQSPVTVGLRDLPYGGRCPSAHAFTRWWQDAVANARKCMAAAQSRQAAYANKARRDVEYKVGQKVLLSTKNLKLQPGKARKLIPRYVGPFEILLLVGAVAVKLDLPASMSRLHPVFHVSLIKPYTGTDVGFMPPPVTWMDETPVYYVERLLDHKGVKDNKASFYLVQWEGYDSTHNTWEPRSNLTDCDKVLAEYNAIHHLKLRPARRGPTVAPTPEAVAAREAADAARLVSPRDAAIARLPANIDPASPAAIELINLLEEQAWPEAHTEYPVYLHGRSVTEHEAMLEASLQRMVARNAAADAPLVEEGQLEDDDEEEELDERDTAIQELHASLQAREDVLVAVQARLTALEASQAAVNAGVSPAVGLSSAAPVRSPPPHGLAAGQHRNTVANLFSAGRFSSGQPAGAVAPQSAAPQENDPSAADVVTDICAAADDGICTDVDYYIRAMAVQMLFVASAQMSTFTFAAWLCRYRRRPGSPHSYSGLVTPVAPVALVAPPLPVPTLQLPRLRRLLPRLPRACTPKLISGCWLLAHFLCDTGATHSFVSTAFALKHALPLEPLPSAQKWSLADNTTLSCKQFATVDLCLPGHCATCKLTVMPSFVQGYDVLLGDDWLFANKAILSYEGKTLSLSAAGKTAVTLPCPAVAAPKYVGQCSAVRPTPAFLINALKAKPELISATQASRWLLKGGRAVVALVMTEGSASAGPGTPSDKDDPHIPAAIKAELQTLLDEYSDVFKPLTDTPPERPVGHTIPLVPDARPPVTPMYRLSKPEQEELKRQIQDYLSKGMIEPSSSPYAAPILFVQKKSGELRMCIDYRQLNKLTLRDQYPLPRIDDLFDRLSGCSVFSSLDLRAGYHQIRITPEDVPKTAFRTPEGHFQFKVLSFGLTNAPATFQRVMNDAFAPVLGKCALVYLDDILVMSKSLPEHLQHLRLVFDLLRKNKLYAKMSKCEFMQLTLRFLGHVISAGAISVDPDKVRAIVDWPVPSSLTQLQSFLGAANFVRKFVHNFSAISAPLTDLCGKLSATFPWHSWPDHERLAFYELKAAVANVPMLRLPDHTQPFQVYCDASLQGVGAVLMQDGYPLAYLYY
ncbi:hypothetical protein QJQ45_025945, partial [Haematococcus lacustris]